MKEPSHEPQSHSRRSVLANLDQPSRELSSRVHVATTYANRPQLKAALDYCREGDTLVVHSLDRLARNTEDLLRIVRELNSKGVTVEFVKNNLTFKGGDDPTSVLLLTILGAVATMERALIRERQREGIDLAKARGVYKGGQPKLTPMQAQDLRERAKKGTAKVDLARHYGISRQAVYDYLRAG